MRSSGRTSSLLPGTSLQSKSGVVQEVFLMIWGWDRIAVAIADGSVLNDHLMHLRRQAENKTMHFRPGLACVLTRRWAPLRP